MQRVFRFKCSGVTADGASAFNAKAAVKATTFNQAEADLRDVFARDHGLQVQNLELVSVRNARRKAAGRLT